MNGIIYIDMHLRDERILKWLVDHASPTDRTLRIAHDEIATQFGCHRNTARAIITRLEGAGYLEIDRSAKRGGYLYRVRANST